MSFDRNDFIEALTRLVTEPNVGPFLERASTAVRGSPDDLRALGMTVAVHNDYRLNGKPHTFWLMTLDKRNHPTEPLVAFKGEGETDAAALDQIRAAFAKSTDNLHHAPMCAANHYHGMRAPTGQCNCGALAAEARP